MTYPGFGLSGKLATSKLVNCSRLVLFELPKDGFNFLRSSGDGVNAPNQEPNGDMDGVDSTEDVDEECVA